MTAQSTALLALVTDGGGIEQDQVCVWRAEEEIYDVLTRSPEKMFMK